jgi:hypothetical protein
MYVVSVDVVAETTTMKAIQERRPTTRLTMTQSRAFREDSAAPWKSPAIILGETCEENTMAAIPVGRKHKSVTRMAATKYVCGAVLCPG